MKVSCVMSQFRRFRSHWLAVLLLLVLGPSISATQALHATGTVRHHAVMRPVPKPTGSLAPAPSTQLNETFNWAGYAIESFLTGDIYTSAQGSWVVPASTFVNAANVTTSGMDAGTEASSNWVGIGGTCTDATCASSDPSLIQLGTESDAFNDGSHNYFAWYELLPANSVTISDQNNNPLPVSPGDVITASVQCVASCGPGTQTWVLSMVDKTQGWTFTQDFSYASSLLSAEWIEEAPSDDNNNVFPLADFGQSSFTSTSANGANPNLNYLLDGIAMTDSNDPNAKNPTIFQTAIPSMPSGGDAFSACWAAGSGFAPCSYSGLPAPNTPQLVAAVLPSSRSVVVDSTATVFTTIVNPGPGQGNSCAIQPLSNGNTFSGTFFYQTTSAATNTPDGTPNTPVNIPAGGAQSFLLGLTPQQISAATDVQFSYVCQGELPALPIIGVNTLAFSASTTAVPDVIAEVSTVTNDGTLHIPGATATGAFAMATANLGAAGPLTVTANTGSAALPLTITVCETVTGTGACMAPPAASVPVTIGAGAEPTFSIFATAAGAVPFIAATNRIFVQFTDGTGTVRGSSSVAVTTN